MNSLISSKCRLSFITGVAVICLLLISTANGFQFYLHSGERRCFTESVPAHTKVLGEYTVSTGQGSMSVDISVRIPEESINLYHKRNIDHGKFAFVVPFRDTYAKWRVLSAALHRRRMMNKIGEVFDKQSSEKTVGDHRRKLLSSSSDYGGHIHHANLREGQFNEHGRAKPPSGHQEDRKSDAHDSDNRHVRRDSYHREHEDSRAHEHHDHDDDFDDDIDDFDMDDYDGIDDEELDDELAHEEAAHMKAKGGAADASDIAKDAELFDTRKIEICVSSDGVKDAHKRRVRLIVHKGETAHDYTRLAKKEHMKVLEVSLRRVSEELHELMHELDKARQMEDSLRRVNENTNSRVVILAIVSLVSMAAASSYQAVYTKRFLKRKKIL